MFRKKKVTETVVVLDDDPPIDAKKELDLPNSPLNARKELGLSNPSLDESTTAGETDDMTTQQMQQFVRDTAQSGKNATTRALQMATEAREIGVNTATTMQQQTAQLEKLSEDIEVVHDYLDKSESKLLYFNDFN